MAKKLQYERFAEFINGRKGKEWTVKMLSRETGIQRGTVGSYMHVARVAGTKFTKRNTKKKVWFIAVTPVDAWAIGEYMRQDSAYRSGSKRTHKEDRLALKAKKTKKPAKLADIPVARLTDKDAAMIRLFEHILVRLNDIHLAIENDGAAFGKLVAKVDEMELLIRATRLKERFDEVRADAHQ